MREEMKIVLEKIKEYETILIFRHFRPDGDAVGSSMGLATLLKNTYPEKKIFVQNADFSDYLAFLGKEDELLPDEAYEGALGIVVDTGTKERISNQKYSLCKELIKIDHHIPMDSYADYEWVEEHRSSCCEMIAAFYEAFREELKMDEKAATFLYAGMVTDSGRFRFREVSPQTMRLAGLILSQGIDTEKLYANLYMKEYHTFRFEGYVYKKMQLTENGVAHLFVTKKMKKKFGLSNEDASASVSYMDSIKNSLVWIAFIEGDDGKIRVRLRSRFLPINDIAEKYRGGGHAQAAGATLHSKAEIKTLLKEADEKLKEYKRTHEGWL